MTQNFFKLNDSVGMCDLNVKVFNVYHFVVKCKRKFIWNIDTSMKKCNNRGKRYRGGYMIHMYTFLF